MGSDSEENGREMKRRSRWRHRIFRVVLNYEGWERKRQRRDVSASGENRKREDTENGELVIWGMNRMGCLMRKWFKGVVTWEHEMEGHETEKWFERGRGKRRECV